VKVVTVVGARPQFIKAATVSRIFREQFARRVDEVLVHTGQHFDANMSGVFFEELDIPVPRYNLSISGGMHGAMTGRMLEALEIVLRDEKPDWVLVYGDTNSTLAGALAAVKLQMPVAHIEAGLRSFNMKMPEEVNRVVVDHISTLLFSPSATAVSNLRSEGITEGVSNVGDVMYDAALFYAARAEQRSNAIQRFGVARGAYVLVTCHRAENTDDRLKLSEILGAIDRIARRMPVVFPLHPRTRQQIEAFGLAHLIEKVRVCEPLSFLDMVALERAARLVLTDSGGVQKEAFFYRVPCITMREETEWVETVASGCNRLAGASSDSIVAAVDGIMETSSGQVVGNPYGQGDAAVQIARMLTRHK
jgi:UDP-GlcNAc3NAcA epimerase